MYEDEEILAAEEAARRRRVEENETNFARLSSIATSAEVASDTEVASDAEVASDTEVAGPRYSADAGAGTDAGEWIAGARPAAGGDGVLPAAGGEDIAQPRIIAESNVYEIPAPVPNVESSISEAEVDAGIEQDEKRRPLEDFADSGEKRSVVRYYDAEDPKTTWTVNGRDVDKFMSDRTAEGKTVRVDAPVEFEDEGGKTYVAYSSEQGELRTTAAYAGQRLAPVKYFVAPEAITTADGMTYHKGERVRVVAWEGDDQKANDARIKMNELRANGFELVGGRPDDFSVAGEALKSAAAGYYSKRDENAFDTVVRVAGESLKGGSAAMGDFVIGAAKGVVNAGLDVAAMAAGAGMNGALPGGVTGMLNPSLPDPDIARASGDMIREAKAGVNEVAETASRSMREELLDGEYWAQDTEEGRSALSGVSEFFKGAGEIQGLGGVGKVFGHAATSIAMGAMGYQGIYDDPELREMLDSGDAGQRIKAHLIGAAKGAAMAFGGKIVNRLTEAGLPVDQARKIGAAAFGQMAGNILRGSVEFAGFNDLNILVDVASKGALTDQGNARMAALAEAFRTGSFESPEAREYWQGVLEQAYDETISGLASGAFVGVAGAGAATIKGAAARMKAARAGWQDYVTSTIKQFNAQRNQALEANAQAFADSVASGELAGVIEGKRVGKGAKEGGAWVPTGTETTPGGGVVRTGTDGRTEVVTPGGVVLDGEGATVKTVAAGKTPDHTTRNAVILARSMRSGAAAGETVELANITGELPSVKGDGAGVNGKPAAKVPVVLFRGEDGALEVVSGRGRVANARASGENAIRAVVLDAKDGWTRDGAQTVDTVENLMDGANMTGAARVAAYERLGVGWEEANAMGLVSGKLAKEAWDVAHSHAQPIQDRVADETIGLGVGAELVRGLTERDTGLRGEELWRLHERASYALANATRADAREFVARVRAEIDSRRARGLEVRADECVDAALETGRADGLRLVAAERGVTEEAAKQVAETVVDDGGRPRTVEDVAGENRGAVERLEENTGETYSAAENTVEAGENSAVNTDRPWYDRGVILDKINADRERRGKRKLNEQTARTMIDEEIESRALDIFTESGEAGNEFVEWLANKRHLLSEPPYKLIRDGKGRIKRKEYYGDPAAEYLNTFFDGIKGRDREQFENLLFGEKGSRVSTRTLGNDARFDDLDFDGHVSKFLSDYQAYDEFKKRGYKTLEEIQWEESEAAEIANTTTISGEEYHIDELALKERADEEYDAAVAEVNKAGVQYTEYFSKNKLKELKAGDTIRFDHSRSDWTVESYDENTGVLTVSFDEIADNPLFSEAERAEMKGRKFQITENGFKEVKENANGTEPANEKGTAETVSGNARSEQERSVAAESNRAEEKVDRAPAWLRATGEDGVFEIPDCASARVEAKDGKYIISGLELADIDARPDDIVDLIEELSKSGNVEFTSELVRLKVIDAIEKRMDFETVERLTTTAQHVADRMTGGTVRVRVGTSEEKRAIMERNGVRLIEGEDGDAKGAWDPRRNEVVLFDGADAKTVAHELLMHVTYSWAKANSPELYERLRDAADNSPAAIKDAIKRTYGEIGQDALLDEILAGRFERKLGAEFRKMLHEDAEVKTWWEKVWQWVRDVFAEMGTRLGLNDVDLKEVLGKETADEAVEALAKEILDGKRLGKMDNVSKRVEDSRLSLERAEEIADRSRAYFRDYVDGSKKDSRSPVNAPTMTKEELENGLITVKKMVEAMRPYYQKTKNGVRYLPEENYDGSTIFDNASYGKTIENSLICWRTLSYIDFADAVKKRLGRPMTAKESFLVSQMLYEIATEPQCLYCYVSLDRKAYDEFLKKYIEQRQGVIDEYSSLRPDQRDKSHIEALYKKFLNGRKNTKNMRLRFESWIRTAEIGNAIQMAEMTTREIRSGVKAETVDASVRNRWDEVCNKLKSLSGAERKAFMRSREYLDAFVEYAATRPGQMEDAERYAQSASWAKSTVDYRSYTGEILKATRDTFDKVMAQYGLRFYSFSEYSPAFIVENMQQVVDAALRGMKGFAYTKKTDFARIFAPSGMNINISCYGRFDSNGKMVMDERQGANWDEVKALRKKHPGVGAVFVATDYKALEWALGQDWIDVIIPFHIVRTGSDIAEFYKWENFTKDSADKNSKGKKADIHPHEHKNSEEEYKRLVRERGLRPRFLKYFNHPGYMKLIRETRRSVDDTPMLMPNFDLGSANKSWSEFVKQGGYYGNHYKVDDKGFESAVNRVADDIVSGKSANEVDYGRQDVPVDMAEGMYKMRKSGRRTHGISVPVGKFGGQEIMLQRGGSDAQRALRAIRIGGTRVVRPNENGERTPGGEAASRARYDWESLPPQQRTNVQTYSFSGSELVRMYKLITGGTLPPHTVGALRGEARQNSGRMGWTTGDRVAVLKDIFGVVDASDADAIKQQLKMMGMFKNEDMAWCVAHTPDQIAQERAASEQMQGDRLQKLGEERIEGRTPGGQRAAVNVMAANIGKVLCDLPNDIGGNLGQVRTLGQGILSGFGAEVRSQQNQMYYVQEAANMMNWWHGRNPGDRGYYDATAIASDPRALRDVLAESFGVFLTSPDTMASMSPGLWRNMLEMIGSSPRLENAWRAIKTTAQNEGSASRVLREARMAATRQHEIAMQKMAEEASKPVGTGWQRMRDATSYNINTVTGPMFLHLERGKLAELGELKKLLKQGRITQQDYDAQAKHYEDLIQEVKLGLLTMDRGKANEIRSYLWDQDVLFESARRANVNMQDWWDYGHLMRVIETGGRAAVRGESPRDARISLDALRARIGDAKFRQIEDLARKFQANRERHLLEDPRLVEAFGQEYVDYLKANVHYVRTERIESPEELARIEAARAAWRQAHQGEDDVTTDMLETVKRYARGINSGGADTVSHALEGSLRDAKDWMYATLRNDERIMQFAERNNYVISMRNALVALKCEGVHDLPYDQAASYRGGRARYGTINYIEGGQKRTLVVPKVIEDGFVSRINDMDGWGAVGRVLHGTMIDYNFAYTPRNITRNLNANEVNLEGMHASRLKTVGRYLAPGIAQHADNALTMFARHLPKGLVQNPIARVMLGRNTNIFYAREAQRLTDLYFRPETYLDREAKANAAAARGDLAPAAELAEDLKRLKFVMAGNSLISRWQVTRGDRFLDDFMKSRGLSAGWKDAPNATPVQKILRGAGSMASWPFRANARYNAELEVWTKIVGSLQQLDYRKRTGAGPVDAGSVGYATMMGGGIPWYERPSQQCKVINYVCNMYYQTAKNGTLRWAENVHQRPREVLQKMAVESIGPRLFNRIMIAGGGLAYLIWSAFDGDEEKIAQSQVGDLYAQLNRYNSWYKGQSEYMKRYYDCMPIAKYGDTVVSFCAPMTDEEKLLLPFVDAMVARWSPNPVDPTVTWGEAISQSIKGPLIPDVFARSPVFALLQDVAAPLVGVNPWDSYHQKLVYNPDLFARRGESAVDMMDMSLEIVKQALNDVGVGRALNVSRWGIDDGVKGDLPESLEIFMRDVPGVSGVVGAMLRCSNAASVKRQAVEEMLEPRLAAQRSAAHDGMRAWLASGNSDDGVAVIDRATARYGWSPAERAAAMRKMFNAHSYAARVTPAAEVWKLRKAARKGGQDVRERIELYLSNSEY